MAQGNNAPSIPTPVISVTSSFFTYHCMKERGGRLVGEQSIEHIIAWAAANRLTKTTLRNDGFCVHVTVDTERDDPFFALKWVSLTYAHYKRQFQLTLLVRTLGMLQRHPLTLR